MPNHAKHHKFAWVGLPASGLNWNRIKKTSNDWMIINAYVWMQTEFTYVVKSARRMQWKCNSKEENHPAKGNISLTGHVLVLFWLSQHFPALLKE